MECLKLTWSLCAVCLTVVAQQLEPYQFAAPDGSAFVFQNNKRSILNSNPDAAVGLEPLFQAGLNGFGGSSQLLYRGYGGGLPSGFDGFGASPPGSDFDFGLQRSVEGFEASPPVGNFQYATGDGGLDARYPFAAPQLPVQQFPIRLDGRETGPGNYELPLQQSPAQESPKPVTLQTVPQIAAGWPLRPDATGSSISNDVQQPSQQQSYSTGDGGGLQGLRSVVEESRSYAFPSAPVTLTTTEAPTDLISELRPPAPNSLPFDYSKYPPVDNVPHGGVITSPGPVDQNSGSFRGGSGSDHGDPSASAAYHSPVNATAGINNSNFRAGSQYPDPNPIPVNTRVPVSKAAAPNSPGGPNNIFPANDAAAGSRVNPPTFRGQFDPIKFAVYDNSWPGDTKNTAVSTGVPFASAPVLNPTVPNGLQRSTAQNLISDHDLYNTVFDFLFRNGVPNTISKNGNVLSDSGNVRDTDSNAILSNEKRESSDYVHSPPNKAPLCNHTNDRKNSQ